MAYGALLSTKLVGELGFGARNLPDQDRVNIAAEIIASLDGAPVLDTFNVLIYGK